MQRRMAGFTVVELMITLIIGAVLLAMAIPNFTSMVHSSRAQSMADDFAAALNFTRTESLKLATRVTICASSDGKSCTGEWNEGWIIFQDYAATDNDAPVIEKNGIKNLLKTTGKSKINSAITVKAGGNNQTFIRFSRLGALSKGNNAAAIDVRMKVTGCKSGNAKKVSVSLSGMIRISPDVCE
ncbi:MAG: hypothetical protein B0W54_15740 [Cellvibrio sp. 79]|nr:MAG: hypothetical protein B0W54_15740 [Cellvibrio sp. 79]